MSIAKEIGQSIKGTATASLSELKKMRQLRDGSVNSRDTGFTDLNPPRSEYSKKSGRRGNRS